MSVDSKIGTAILGFELVDAVIPLAIVGVVGYFGYKWWNGASSGSSPSVLTNLKNNFKAAIGDNSTTTGTTTTPGDPNAPLSWSDKLKLWLHAITNSPFPGTGTVDGTDPNYSAPDGSTPHVDSSGNPLSGASS